jgi:uncharacterized membrane protein YeaQ/YmgE (transglycosylase-associated protein family)|tara:strand:+ start:8137 stop:8373 length:237 start_codon:yes stop_codon:yes gene_type:complete
MAILDPLKVTKSTVKANMLGAVGGGVAGVMLVRKYAPTKGWLSMTLGVVGGLVGGAFLQSKLKAKKGSIKSGKTITTK